MKTCPVCKALVFDDMDVCYGCLYRFDSQDSKQQKPAEGTTVEALEENKSQKTCMLQSSVPSPLDELVSSVEEPNVKAPEYTAVRDASFASNPSSAPDNPSRVPDKTILPKTAESSTVFAHKNNPDSLDGMRLKIPHSTSRMQITIELVPAAANAQQRT